MAKQDTSTEFKQDEFSKIFDEYRAKIEEITRRSEKNLHIIEAKPGENHADDHEHIEVISAPKADASNSNNVQAQLESVLLQKVESGSNPQAVKNDIEIKVTNTPPPQVPPLRKSRLLRPWLKRAGPSSGNQLKF